MCFANAAKNLRIKDRRTEGFKEEYAKLFSCHKRWKQLQSFFDVKSRTMPADQVKCRVKEVVRCLHHWAKVDLQKYQKDITCFCPWLVCAFAVSGNRAVESIVIEL